MIISALSVNNFRNYNSASLSFTEGLNILVGANAQGKTNLLEAIYLCAIGKSYRTSKEKLFILDGKDRAEINLKFVKKSGDNKITIKLSSKENKQVFINDIPVKKLSELIGELNIVFFFPEDLRLIKEAPQDRRRFMDIDISQASKNYLYLLQKYDRILNQRNKLLKTCLSVEALERTISIWDEQLSEVASKIIFARIKFINRLKPHVESMHKDLTGDESVLTISYQGVTGESSAEIKEKLLEIYSKSHAKDFELKFTSTGPHRDDIKISLDGIDLRTLGSQGQQRTAALALKLAELDIFEKELNDRPILLLDDVFSELDHNRRNRLINVAKRQQTFIACTDLSGTDVDGDINVIKVEKGKIVE